MRRCWSFYNLSCFFDYVEIQLETWFNPDEAYYRYLAFKVSVYVVPTCVDFYVVSSQVRHSESQDTHRVESALCCVYIQDSEDWTMFAARRIAQLGKEALVFLI